MSRRLSPEERRLWEHIRRSVRPLRPQPAKVEPAASPEAETPPRRTAKLQGTPGEPHLTRRSEPRLLPLEERTRRRLSRGLTDVDARLDLHGMSQERAFRVLLSFLQRSRACNRRLVLVITGRGRADEDGRGVLREAVPAWLARPELRGLVIGFEEAGRRHGGAGALYVRLRRRREARPASSDD